MKAKWIAFSMLGYHRAMDHMRHDHDRDHDDPHFYPSYILNEMLGAHQPGISLSAQINAFSTTPEGNTCLK